MAGLDGTWRSTVALRDGRFDTRADLGTYRIADLYDGQTRWRVEPSGGSHPLDSDFARATARTEAWLARFGWLQPDNGAAYSASTRQIDGGKAYLVRTATPQGGRPVTLWLDPISGDVAKTERRGWIATRTTRYSDYRLVAGQRLPFAIAIDDNGDEQKISIARYEFDKNPSPASFRPPPRPEDGSVPSAGTTVPATVFPQLVVQASINGNAPMGFVFDTGGHSILTPAAADALGLKTVGESQTGGSGAGTLTQRETRVRSLQIGDAVLRDQQFSVLPLSYASMEQGAQPPLAGLLGLEILERFTVRINYRAGTLSLLPIDAPIACSGTWQPARFTDDMPTVDATLDGIPGTFTIDTGNNSSLILYDHWMRQNGVAERYRAGIETVSYGAGGASRNWVSYGRSFRMGGVTVARPLLRTTDDKGGVALSISEAGNLGTALLANYTLTFDYARSRICFEYVPGYRPVPFNRAGLRATKSDPGGFTVALVNAGSPAALAGLRKDDRIVSVDGRPAHLLSGGDLTRTLTQSPGTKISIVYQRGKASRRAKLTLRELLTGASS